MSGQRDFTLLSRNSEFMSIFFRIPSSSPVIPVRRPEESGERSKKKIVSEPTDWKKKLVLRKGFSIVS
jgi:hypothetical protein